jgi:hypothetical protein
MEYLQCWVSHSTRIAVFSSSPFVQQTNSVHVWIRSYLLSIERGGGERGGGDQVHFKWKHFKWKRLSHRRLLVKAAQVGPSKIQQQAWSERVGRQLRLWLQANRFLDLPLLSFSCVFGVLASCLRAARVSMPLAQGAPGFKSPGWHGRLAWLGGLRGGRPCASFRRVSFLKSL